MSTNVTADGKLKRLDDNQGALVSTDLTALGAYKKKKAMGTVINKLVADQAETRRDIEDIKSMLAIIVEKIS